MDEIYSETLLDHYSHPHHAGTLKKPTVRIAHHNPLCGDTVHLDIAIGKNNTISDSAFTGTGCVLSQAGTSLFLDSVSDMSLDDVAKMTSDTMDTLLGTRVSPGRRLCADLGMTAVKEAISKKKKK